jgi:hypothetical protein
MEFTLSLHRGTLRALRKGVIAFVLAGVLAAPVLAAPATKNVNLLKLVRAQLAFVKGKTNVPVLLPATLPLAGKASGTLYVTSFTGPKHWGIQIAGAPNCGGANACFVASFEGQRSGKLPGSANVRVSGSRGFYKGITCGGSCSPASLWFVRGGVLYTWQMKDPPPRGTKALILRLANQAIAAGGR